MILLTNKQTNAIDYYFSNATYLDCTLTREGLMSPLYVPEVTLYTHNVVEPTHPEPEYFISDYAYTADLGYYPKSTEDLDAKLETLRIESAEKLTHELAAYRYGKESEGIVYEGKSFPTDRESRGILTSVLLVTPDEAVVQWKVGLNEYLPLTKAQLLEVSLLIFGHVQSCFDTEKQALELLNQKSLEDLKSTTPESLWAEATV